MTLRGYNSAHNNYYKYNDSKDFLVRVLKFTHISVGYITGSRIPCSKMEDVQRQNFLRFTLTRGSLHWRVSLYIPNTTRYHILHRGPWTQYVYMQYMQRKLPDVSQPWDKNIYLFFLIPRTYSDICVPYRPTCLHAYTLTVLRVQCIEFK